MRQRAQRYSHARTHACTQTPPTPHPLPSHAPAPRAFGHHLLGEHVPALEGEIRAHGTQEALPCEGKFRGRCEDYSADDWEEGEEDEGGGLVAEENRREENCGGEVCVRGGGSA
jgi:hypothetical protein